MINRHTPHSAADGAQGRGFTLVEMLVSVALAVIIMLIVGTVFTQAARLFRLSRGRIRAVNNARVAMDFIEADLEGAFDGSGSIFQGIKAYDEPTPNFGDDYDVDNDGDGQVHEDGPDGTDNDNDGQTDEDPYDFLHPGLVKELEDGTIEDDDYFPGTPGDWGPREEWYQWRSGVELTTLSRYSYAADGTPVSKSHVMYYVTRGEEVGPYRVGRLIRCEWKYDGGEMKSVFDDSYGGSNIATPSETPVGRRASREDDPSTPGPHFHLFEVPPGTLVSRKVVAFGVVRFRLRYLDNKGTPDDPSDDEWVDEWKQLGNTGDPRPEPPEAVLVQMDVIDQEGQLAEDDAEPYRISRVVEVGLTTD